MKNWLCAALLLTACSSPSQDSAATGPVAPAPNTVVAADSVTHDDGLNSFPFAVTLRSTAKPGIYDVLVHDGPKEAAGQLTLPRGAEAFPMRLRREGGAAFNAGFSTPDDTTFLPYFRIAATASTIEMKYTHAYSFQ